MQASMTDMAEADRKKTFAREQIEKLVSMGFSRAAAVQIMRAAGPGRCVEAATWAKACLERIGSVDALYALFQGVSGAYFGKDRRVAALKAFGLEMPRHFFGFASPEKEFSAHGLDSLLSGAIAAIQSRDIYEISTPEQLMGAAVPYATRVALASLATS